MASPVTSAPDDMETTMLSIWGDRRMRLQCQAMALILGDQAAKDPAAAAGLEHRIIIFIAGYSGEHRQEEGRRWEGWVLPNPRSRKPLKRWTHFHPTAWRRAKVYRTRQTFNVFNSCIFTPLISTANAAIDKDDRVGSDTTANASLETSASTVAVSGSNSVGVITTNSISCAEQSTRPWWCSTTYLHNPDAHKVVHYCKVCHMGYYHGGTVIMRLYSLWVGCGHSIELDCVIIVRDDCGSYPERQDITGCSRVYVWPCFLCGPTFW